MAFRTEDHSDASLFKNRLWYLMEAKGIYTAKELAKNLYNNGYVKVRQKPNYESKEKNEGNAIGAVEKKVQTHLGSDTTDKLQGEYVSAYCNFFSCSADYLFGNINETTRDIRYISQETGLAECSIKYLQNLWLKYRTGKEISTFDIVEVHQPNNTEIKSHSIPYSSCLDSTDSFKSFWEKYGICSPEYRADPSKYLNELIQEKQKKSRALFALNGLLSSPTGETILENIYAYLKFEYEPSQEEIDKTEEFNKKHGTHYKSVIKGKNGYVDSEYLSNAFLLSLQQNLRELKKDLNKKNAD